MMIWALKQQLNKSLTPVLPFNVALEPRNYPNIFSTLHALDFASLCHPACPPSISWPRQHIVLRFAFSQRLHGGGRATPLFFPFFLLLIQPCFRKEAGKAKPRDEAITMTSEAEGLEQTHPHRNLTPK